MVQTTHLYFGGEIHGILSVCDRIFEKYQSKIMETVRWVLTFSAINVLWLLFRSETIFQWKGILVKILTFQNLAVSDGLIQSFVLPESAFIFQLLHIGTINEAVRGFGLLIFMAGSFILCLIPENNYKNKGKNNFVYMIMAAGVFVWSFLCLSSESVFVYFNF